MTPSERISLRSALLVTAGIYVVLFAGLAIWNPLAAREAGLRSELRVVILSPGPAATPAGGAGASPAPQAVRPAADLPGAAASPEIPSNHAPVPAAAASVAAAPLAAAQVAPASVAASSAAATAPPAEELPGADAAKAAADSVPAGGAAASAASESAAPAAATVPAATPAPSNPNGSGGTAAGGHAAADGSSAVAPLLALLEQRITAARVYPQAAREQNIEGSVRLRASVAADGRLVGANVVGSSGSSILDNAGAALVRRVFPIPNDLGRGFTVEVTITYRLEDGPAAP
jgi:TonB family protein